MPSQELGRLVFGRSFDGPGAAFVVRRANGQIAAANAAIAQLVGRSPEALVGLPAYDLLGDDVDVLDPPSTPLATRGTVRQAGAELAVALSVAAVDHDRAGALTACRARPLDDAEARCAALERRQRALEASCAELSHRARAPVAPSGPDLGHLAAQLGEISTALGMRALCADVVGRLGQPLGALESTLRLLAGRTADIADEALRAPMMRRCQQARGAVARIEAPMIELLRAGRRELDVVPEWIDLAIELATAGRLAELRGVAWVRGELPRGRYTFVPHAAFHYALAAAIDATGARGFVVETRADAWAIVARGPGGGAEALRRLEQVAPVADGWGFDVAIARHDGELVAEVAAPIMFGA